jgi:ABC-type nitrate/sulfonate/bicarbonate transport system ATPase subunit
MMKLLELEGIHQTYPELDVLRDINAAVAEGEHLAVLGPSGCGKSTLLRLIAGLELPSAGRILWRGTDIRGATGRFGLMSQQDQLLPWKPLWENAALPWLLRGRRRADARRDIQPLLEEMGLGEFAAFLPGQLSGGMRQRAAFLRTSLAGSRELILLDEPFAALDVLTRGQLQAWLADWLAHHRATMILVTHSVEEALLLCQRVIVLDAAPGRVLADEAVRDDGAPFADKPWQPAFLEQKKRLLGLLARPSAACRPEAGG